jgi:hypothetical protein
MYGVNTDVHLPRYPGGIASQVAVLGQPPRALFSTRPRLYRLDTQEVFQRVDQWVSRVGGRVPKPANLQTRQGCAADVRASDAQASDAQALSAVGGCKEMNTVWSTSSHLGVNISRINGATLSGKFILTMAVGW